MQESVLELRQRQRLSLEMQNVIRLIALNPDELNTEINALIQSNPALEFAPADKSATILIRRMTGFVHSDASGHGNVSNIPNTGDSIRDDLKQQVRLTSADPEIQCAALFIIRVLSDKGYFLYDIDLFSAEAGIPRDLSLKGLDLVQSLDPAGIGARSVSECLELQLRRMPDINPLCIKLVQHFLPDLARGNIQRISRELKTRTAAIEEALKVISSLKPYPCSLDDQPAEYLIPEFSVLREGLHQLVIEFYSDFFPQPRMDSSFLTLGETLSGRDAEFAKKMVSEANNFIKSLALRHSLMENLARIIVEEQKDFFLEHRQPKPLRIDETAQSIGVHESTVYRAVRNKCLYCEYGIFPLSFFFPKALSGGVSKAEIIGMIRELSAKGALSDQRIADELQRLGISISRRTVNKYRSQMDAQTSWGKSTRG